MSSKCLEKEKKICDGLDKEKPPVTCPIAIRSSFKRSFFFIFLIKSIDQHTSKYWCNMCLLSIYI